jgi:hypothetical protein
MTFTTLTNLVLVLLCIAVLAQSARVMRSFRAVKAGDLGDTVKSLDRATTQARIVLAEMKDLLSTDGAANARNIASGESLRDELSVMVGIGNAVAERILDAATAAEAARASVESQASTAGVVPHKPAGRATRRKRRTGVSAHAADMVVSAATH